MLKNLKRMFVNLFVVLFSSVFVVNTTILASFSRNPNEKYNGHYLDFESSIDKASFAKNAYDELFALYQQILLNPEIISPSSFFQLKHQYTLVCKNLFYLIDSKEKYDDLCESLNEIVDSLFGRDLNSALQLDSFDKANFISLYNKTVRHILPSENTFFEDDFNLFDSIFVYSYISTLDDITPVEKSLLEITLILNNIHPETLTFFRED